MTLYFIIAAILTLVGGAGLIGKYKFSWRGVLGFILVVGAVLTFANIIQEWTANTIQLDFRPIYRAIWDSLFVPIGNWLQGLGG